MTPPSRAPRPPSRTRAPIVGMAPTPSGLRLLPARRRRWRVRVRRRPLRRFGRRRAAPRDRRSRSRATARATRSRAPTAASSDSAARRRSPLRVDPLVESAPGGRARGPAAVAVRGSRRASSRRTRSRQSQSPSQDPFLRCTRAHESDSAGGYRAVSPDGVYRGAYQFLRSTWNNVARAAGRPDLVGVDPAAASPADQDQLALFLFRQRGTRAVGWSLRRACSSRIAHRPYGPVEPMRGAGEGRPPRRPYRFRMVDGPPSPDLAIGSFTDHGPWVVEPEAMTWRARRRPAAGAGPGRVPALDGDRPPAAARAAGPRRRPGRQRARRLGRRRAPQGSAALAPRPVPAAAHRVRAPRARPTSSSARSSPAARACSPRSWSPSSSCCATACRPSRSTTCAGSSSSSSVARSTTCSRRSSARRSRRRRSRRCTRRALRTGEDVVVKVQRPQIARLVREDIEAMSWLAPHLDRAHPGRRAREPARAHRAVRGDDRRGARLPPRSAEHARHRARPRRDRAARDDRAPPAPDAA